MKIRFYMSESGVNPVRRYLDGLSNDESRRVFAALLSLEKEGTRSPVMTRQIEGKLWEIKVSRHRIFYFLFLVDEMVLLSAYKKQGQKAPRREIETAKRRMEQVLTTEKGV